jgi:hypothetical protein
MAATEFTGYAAFDLDVKFLLAMLRNVRSKHPHNFCVPESILCLSERDGAVSQERSTKEGGCPELSQKHRFRPIRAGIVIVKTRTQTPEMIASQSIVDAVRACSEGGMTRFAVCNLGLYPAASIFTGGGHANALIFDGELHIIERFDPWGHVNASLDRKIGLLFRQLFSRWNYKGTRYTGRPRGPQAVVDAFEGMCVTYSLWYVLMRLQNPDVPPEAINTFFLKQDAFQTHRDLLRLNAFVIDTLKQFPRGALVRRGRNGMQQPHNRHEQLRIPSRHLPNCRVLSDSSRNGATSRRAS